MSEFTNFDPKKSLLPNAFASKRLGHDYWVVAESFEYYIGKKSDNVYIRIPKGYLTDGATAPSYLRNYIPAMGQYGAATVVHDYLCERLSIRSGGRLISISRARGDYIFYQAMKVLKVPFYKRSLMYLAVRINSVFNAKGEASLDARKENLEKQIMVHYEKYGTFDLTRSK